MRVNWKGPVLDPSGYAAVARGIIPELSKLCHLQLFRKSDWSPLHYSMSKEEGQLYNKLSKRNRKRYGYSIKHHIPGPSVTRDDCLMTIFELTKIPKNWVGHCNRAKEVWLPNEFNETIFRRSGVKKIHIIEHGVDTDKFNPNGDKFDFGDDYKFLSIFQWNERKNPSCLIRSFFKEFNSSDNVTLILKTYGGNMNKDQHENLLNIINGWRRGETNAKIIYISKNLTEKDMCKLYRSADCFVLPSRAEGWGMPYIEAMSTGLPTIGTNWSGNLHFMKPKNSFLIDIKDLEYIHHYSYIHYQKHMKWSIPDGDHLQKIMRFVYENQKYAKNVGKKARKDVSKLTWKNTANKIIKRLNELG
jgi:hypothetical protein